MGRLAVFVWFGTAWTAFLGVCDTPVVVLCFKGFGGVWLGRVCVGGWVGVFENSRACLYYFLESFFDCQSDSRFALFGVE